MVAVRVLGLVLLLAMQALAADTVEIFGHKWFVPNAADWSTGNAVLHLLVGREPLPGPRRPFQFALTDTPSFRQVFVDADAQPLKRSLIMVFAYQDDAHFNYVHFSTDKADKTAVHNGVFHVYGGERVRISNIEGPAAFAAPNRWYRLKLAWSGVTGDVQGFVDGNSVPALHAVDLSLRYGKVGLGSFNETADFKNVTIIGTR
jgi:hypothetical protein